jgi:hypothetical protein
MPHNSLKGVDEGILTTENPTKTDNFGAATKCNEMQQRCNKMQRTNKKTRTEARVIVAHFVDILATRIRSTLTAGFDTNHACPRARSMASRRRLRAEAA